MQEDRTIHISFIKTIILTLTILFLGGCYVFIIEDETLKITPDRLPLDGTSNKILITVNYSSFENESPKNPSASQIKIISDSAIEVLSSAGFNPTLIDTKDWEYRLLLEFTDIEQINNNANFLRTFTLFLLPFRAKSNLTVNISLIGKNNNVIAKAQKKGDQETIIQPFLILESIFDPQIFKLTDLKRRLVKRSIEEVLNREINLKKF